MPGHLRAGRQRDIGFLIFPGFQLLDLSGPLAAFEVAGRLAGAPYRIHTMSSMSGAIASSSGLQVMAEPLVETALDTFIVVGGSDCLKPASAIELAKIAAQPAAKARRIASVCTGAFVLANAGLLDGKHATTHWQHAALLQRLFPRIKVYGDRIFTQDGPVWTSAGVCAGIDLAFALIEEDLGIEIARATARNLVVYHRRPGGQSQFSSLLELDPKSDRIRDALRFAREHLHEKLPVDRLAEVACLSARQFGRALLAETGETPAKAVERLRAEVARQYIESRSEAIEAIAGRVGFADPERMRRAFIRLFKQTPQEIRRNARKE
ncbi:MAG TPA: GlxA family transcriptional regulator [Cellvibrio sp.]|nr:GlxA family transcriptional regulator [Cellvibrio sp.]